MVVTIGTSERHIKHTLSGDLSPQLGVRNVVVETIRWLERAHRWRFLERPERKLNLRGAISITGGTWTETSRTLTKAAAFTSYTFLEGDQIEITGGTGATADFYPVESRTSANAIVLDTSIGSAADGQVDIAATFDLDAIVLPSDFGELLAISSADLVGDFYKVGYDDLLRLRSGSTTTISPYYYYAITTAPNLTSAGGLPVQRLEIDRPPTSNDTAALSIIYRARIVIPTDDNTYFALPDWMEGVYYSALRAFARGYEEEDIATKGARLTELRAGSEWMVAVEADGATDATVGMMGGGAAQRFHSEGVRWHRADRVITVP